MIKNNIKSEYFVFLIYDSSRKQFADNVEDLLIKELEKYFNAKICNYFNISFNILHNQVKSDEEGPKIIIFFGTKDSKDSILCLELLNKGKDSGIFIIPIISVQEDFDTCIPDILKNINCFCWKERKNPEKRLVRKILENLGINEQQRKIFISYRRIDGLGMADQIFDRLIRQRFNVFLDKYDVDVGFEIQKEIYESIEDKAFVLVIESPNAYKSRWISTEIHYALSHEIPVFLISWCSDDEIITDAIGLPKIKFDKNNDLIKKGNYYIIKENFIEDVINQIEIYHSYGLNQRRNDLIRAIEYNHKPHYKYYNYLKNWIIYLTHSKKGEPDKLITITPRIPQPYDIYFLDNFSKKISNYKEDTKNVLFHKSENIPKFHNKLLKWIIINKKNIEILPFLSR